MNNSIEEKLGGLIQLAKLDVRAVEIERQKRLIPSKQNQILTKLTKIRTTYNNLIVELKNDESKKKSLENEVLEINEKVKASKNKLYDIKTNEAYKMALKEIDNWEHEKKIREDEIIKLMEKQEKNKPEVDRLKEKHKPEEDALLMEEKIINDDFLKFESELKEINLEREKYIRNIDKQLFNHYERIRKVKGGIALVEVVSPNCGGCNLGIRPQIFNQLIRGEVLPCPNCSRLLYYSAPQKEQKENS